MRGWLLVALWAVAATPEDAPRAVLRAPLPGDLARRVQDQAVDSGWRLISRADEGPGGLEADLALAEAHHAQAVVEVLGPPDGPLYVALTDARRGRRYARVVAAMGSGAVTREAAAVLVRDSLLALAEAGALDWSVQESLPPLDLAVSAYGSMIGDGVTLHPGLGLALELGRRGWRARAAVTFGLPRAVDLGPVTLDLAHHEVRLQYGLRLSLPVDLHLEGGLGVGASLQRRSTTRTGPALTPAPASTSAAGSVGLYLRLTAQLGAVQLWMASGADGVFGATAFEVSTPPERETLARPWPIQPWLSVGAAMAL